MALYMEDGRNVMKREKKIFAICDLEEAYVVHLADYLNQSADLPFQVLAFTSLESLIKYASGHEIEILLISVDAMTDEVRELDVHRTIILADKEVPELGENDIFIDKYQDSDSIARLVCSYAGEDAAQLKESMGDCRLYGVYSPVARCGKTMFALTLAQEAAEEGKTLYLNLESCSGFEEIFRTNWREDLADLMYAAKTEAENLPDRMDNVMMNCGNLDICPPAFFPEDIRETTTGMWMEFFASVGRAGGYQTIVLDIGTQVKDIPELLKLCTRSFMPVLPDPVSRAKIIQFEKNMEALSMGEIQKEMVRLYLPQVSVRSLGISLLDDLLYGRMGQFVRRLLDEEEEKLRPTA